jgi:hypothetical protein
MRAADIIHRCCQIVLEYAPSAKDRSKRLTADIRADIGLKATKPIDPRPADEDAHHGRRTCIRTMRGRELDDVAHHEDSPPSVRRRLATNLRGSGPRLVASRSRTRGRGGSPGATVGRRAVVVGLAVVLAPVARDADVGQRHLTHLSLGDHRDDHEAPAPPPSPRQHGQQRHAARTETRDCRPHAS